MEVDFHVKVVEMRNVICFRCPTKGPTSKVDLVNSMRRAGQGDLQNAWVHFYYTHRINDLVLVKL